MTTTARCLVGILVGVAIAVPVGAASGLLRNGGYDSLANGLLVAVPIVTGTIAARWRRRA